MDLFLDGVKAALLADQGFAGGDYTEPPIDGLRAFGTVYAGWVFSQAFFRNEAYKQMNAAVGRGFAGGVPGPDARHTRR